MNHLRELVQLLHLVGLGPFVSNFWSVLGDFWSVLGGFSIPLLGSFLTVDFGTSVPGCRLTLNAVYIDVSGRWGPVFWNSVNSGLKCPFSQCPPC
jgi:hypothetical protein